MKWLHGRRLARQPRRPAVRLRALVMTLAALVLGGTPAGAQDAGTLRVGHFPNVTHVQGLVAHGLTRQGKGWFEQRLGPGVKLEWYVYNAGPSAIEALFAGSIDLTYVGPSPAINGYAKARGADIRIISGAVNGGAALLVQPDSPLKAAADFKGRKIATPQLGNTQDVAARAWLTSGGLKITQTGGEAQVVPTANPDQLSLFKQKQLDGVWTVEPWVTRLELEAGAKVLVEETDAVTTVLATSVKFLKERKEMAQKFAAAHQELTHWIQANPEAAKSALRAELEAEMRTTLAPELIDRAWKRIILTDEVSRPSLDAFVAKAQAAGFLRGAPDMGQLVVRP